MVDRRQEYFEKMGLDLDSSSCAESDRVQEAFNRAHEIRQFEIELYWRRSSYFWTVQAAALAALGFILSSFLSTSLADLMLRVADPVAYNQAWWLHVIAVSAVWLFGFASAIFWSLTVSGSKFWQDNWERHVDLLEEQLSGNLYKTYPNWTSAPYSVSKINRAIAHFSCLLWFAFALAAALVLVLPELPVGSEIALNPRFAVKAAVVGVIVVLFVLFLGWVLVRGLRMDDGSPSGSVHRRDL